MLGLFTLLLPMPVLGLLILLHPVLILRLAGKLRQLGFGPVTQWISLANIIEALALACSLSGRIRIDSFPIEPFAGLFRQHATTGQ
jgi:hypothetical protein